MIRITVELISARGRQYDRLLGVGEISNLGDSADPRLGNYRVWLSKMAPKERQAWKDGRVTLDPRDVERFEGEVLTFDREKRGCWDLLYRALAVLVGNRNVQK